MTAFVRVRVTAETACSDLVLPAMVPLTEVVPDLLRAVGLLDATCVHEGCRIETGAGRRLRPDAGLGEQGVGDDTVLFVRRGLEDDPPCRYDAVLPSPRRSLMTAVTSRLRRPATTRPG